MTLTVRLILLVLALACFLASAAGVPSRLNLQSCGLALLTAALIVT